MHGLRGVLGQVHLDQFLCKGRDMLFTEETKAAWITALRSGEYAQGRGSLVSIDWQTRVKSHCCLGVLADVMGAEEYDTPDEGLGFKFNPSIYGFRAIDDQGYHGGFIPRSIIGFGMQQALVQLNDSGNYTFNDIADRLEQMTAEEVCEGFIVPKAEDAFDY